MSFTYAVVLRAVKVRFTGMLVSAKLIATRFAYLLKVSYVTVTSVFKKGNRSSIENYTFWLLVFTMLYSVFTVYQIYLDHVPYVGIDPAKTTMDLIQVGQKITFHVGFVNVGKSVAYSTKANSLVGFVAQGEHKF